MIIEPSPSDLREKYIDENLTLQEMSVLFKMPIGTLRKRLSKNGIRKSPKQVGINTKKSLLEKYGDDYFSKRIRGYQTKESIELAHKKMWETRHNSIRRRYESEGITRDFLYEKYIEENLSMVAVGNLVGKNKSQIRKALLFFNVKKSHELYEESRQKSLSKVYADPIRVEEISQKVKATIKERYGRDWYYKNPSNLELEVLDFVRLQTPPGLEVINGDRNTISQPRRGGALELDIYIPSLNLAIEVNGDYYHSRKRYELDLASGESNSREMTKTLLCREKGVELLHIWESDWKGDQENQKSLISDKIQEHINRK